MQWRDSIYGVSFMDLSWPGLCSGFVLLMAAKGWKSVQCMLRGKILSPLDSSPPSTQKLKVLAFEISKCSVIQTDENMILGLSCGINVNTLEYFNWPNVCSLGLCQLSGMFAHASKFFAFTRVAWKSAVKTTESFSSEPLVGGEDLVFSCTLRMHWISFVISTMLLIIKTLSTQVVKTLSQNNLCYLVIFASYFHFWTAPSTVSFYWYI